MGDLNLSQMAEAEADYESALGDDSQWEDDPAPVVLEKRRLAAQVTIRLSPEVAEQLRSIAGAAGVGYTSLIRQWIEERATEETVKVLGRNRVQYTIATTVPSMTVPFDWTQRPAAPHT